MMTYGRICSGVTCRSVQKNASTRQLPSGSATSTLRMRTVGNRGVYHRTVPEKTQK
jgi:hypothetical protein